MVVTLIATMMALSLPMLSNANAKARSELCRQNLAEIGQTVASFTQDMNHLPTLHGLEPIQPGLSLPEFIEPRLHTPYVVFCPSDETEQSMVLGTSYQWDTAFNGLHAGELGTMVGLPMMADREAFHTGPDLPINEMMLLEDNEGYRLSLPGEDAQGEPDRLSIYLKKKPKKDKPKKDKPKKPHPGQGNGHAYGWSDDDD